LVYDEENVARYMDALKAVSNKGCILIQFPPSLNHKNLYQLERLLKSIRVYDPGLKWNLAVEFRNKSWYHDEVYELMERNNAGIVLQDIPSSATPFDIPLQSFVYLRFHGPEGTYRGSYEESLLQEYATYIKEWLAENKTVYAYFNNTMGNAFNNLRMLNDLVISSPDHLVT
jgi:uncharacterized protein YecE (DUF72 family)